MEADISRFHPRLDYIDFLTGRREHGRPVLSFRKLSVLVRHLPVESACAGVELNGYALRTTTDVLVAGLFRAMTGVQHPLAETPKERDERLRLHAAEKQKTNQVAVRVKAAQARAAQRRADIAAGQIT